MPNTIRMSAAMEPKNATEIIDTDPQGWRAIHTALVHTAREIALGEQNLLKVALSAVRHATDAGFRSRTDDRLTRFTGKAIMEWQDALFVVNELPGWWFPDEVLLVGWLIECGGPEMGRGPARASFHTGTPEHYVGGTRRLYNRGQHGNGPSWPESRQWRAADCPWMSNAAQAT
jgi:hypothetical protein